MKKAIRTKVLGPTNTKPARIIARDGDNNRVIVSIECIGELDHHRAAVELCHKMGWTGTLIGGWLERGTYVWTFAPD